MIKSLLSHFIHSVISNLNLMRPKVFLVNTVLLGGQSLLGHILPVIMTVHLPFDLNLNLISLIISSNFIIINIKMYQVTAMSDRNNSLIEIINSSYVKPENMIDNFKNLNLAEFYEKQLLIVNEVQMQQKILDYHYQQLKDIKPMKDLNLKENHHEKQVNRNIKLI